MQHQYETPAVVATSEIVVTTKSKGIPPGDSPFGALGAVGSVGFNL